MHKTTEEEFATTEKLVDPVTPDHAHPGYMFIASFEDRTQVAIGNRPRHRLQLRPMPSPASGPWPTT